MPSCHGVVHASNCKDVGHGGLLHDRNHTFSTNASINAFLCRLGAPTACAMRCSSCAVFFVPLVAYVLHIGFWPLPEQVHPAAIDTSAFDEISAVDAAERLLELIAIPTVTQRAPLSNVSAALMLKLHKRKILK